MHPNYYCILPLIITAIILIITAFISFSFLIWILLPLFLLFFIFYMNSTSSFPSLLYEFYFLFSFSFSFLSARRILCTILFLFSLYGGAPIVTQLLLYSPIISYSLYGCAPIVTQSPIISYSLIFNPPPSSMVHSQNVGMWQTPHFCLIKAYYFLAGILDSNFS